METALEWRLNFTASFNNYAEAVVLIVTVYM